MASLMNDGTGSRIERSCGTKAGDWMRIAPSAPGIERVEAYFTGHGFDPHRHDTYAIGFTLEGVQAFRYRGAAERSLAGQVFVLHPDELHDGHAGTSAGFHYKILYVEPRAISDALGAAHPLPFVRETVTADPRLAAAIMPALGDIDRPLEELQRDQVIFDLAEALAAADPSIRERELSAGHWRAVNVARDFLDTKFDRPATSAELEIITGMSRYTLARHFRACLGTSPYRYLVMRRLDRARALIRRGAGLADTAAGCGFADQSHMTRHFTRTYGISPGRWGALSGSGPAH
jgi:AraC-like DNA-binding protein